MTSSYGQAPEYQIKGQLEDSFSYSIPYNANIILLKDKDTAAKVSSDQNGRFLLSVNNIGTYKLYVNHPNYHLFIDTSIVVKEKETYLGLIELDLKSKILDEVVVKDNPTMRIHGDTTDFAADSFLIRQFSSSKELLSKIPGIQIDMNGNITYNGKPVSEVSLDGVPFLNMDPDKLLNLLRGKDLQKIQLFDVKSQLARMTGIDDNSRNVGLNLILKEEAKRGYYGKLAGGLGASKSDAQWDNSSNVNSFNDNRRVMLFTELNNTGSTSSVGETTLPQLSTPPQGKPQYLSGGGHYDTRLLKDKKLNLGIDYTFNKNNQNVITSSNSTNLIPDNEFTTQDQSIAKSSGQTHSINLSAGYKFSTSSTLDITLNSNITKGNDQSQTQSSSNALDGSFLNSSATQATSSQHSPNTLANILYRKMFDKPGRIFNLSFTTNINSGKSDGTQISNSNFNNAALNEVIRQNKNGDQHSSAYTLNAHYSEPLKKGLNLNFDFITNVSNSLANNATYDVYEHDGALTDSLNPLYSSNFKNKNVQNRLNTALQFQSKKIFFSLGGDVMRLNWRQYDITNFNSLEKNYLNILPAATFRYNMTSSSMINLDLRSQTTQPQLSQIQLMTNNNDPLHIVIGNPNLTQSNIYNLSLNYSTSKPSAYKFLNAYATFSLTQNAISLKQYYNTDGKEISQYINTNGNYNGNLMINYNCRLFPKMQATIAETAFFSKSKSLLNNSENSTLQQNYRSSVTLFYLIDTLLNINYSFAFNYSLSQSSVVDNATSKLWNTLQNFDINYNLPKGFSLLSRFNWNLRQKTSAADDAFSIFLWNFCLAKSLGKKEALTAKLFVYDVLNQNKSNSVYYGPNIQSERTSNTIGRYAMLGVVWNFTKR